MEFCALWGVRSLASGGCGLLEHGSGGEGGLSYWALRHAPGRADFHHPESFRSRSSFPIAARPMKFGIDRLLEEPQLRKPASPESAWPCSRILLPSPAPWCTRWTLWRALGDVRLTAAFGPQHGLRGDKQYNMAESDDFIDPIVRHPRLQPVRRGEAADRADDGQLRRTAGGSAGRRLPRLHLLDRAALHAGGSGTSDTRRYGYWIGRTLSAGPWKGLALIPGCESSSAPDPCRCGMV